MFSEEAIKNNSSSHKEMQKEEISQTALYLFKTSRYIKVHQFYIFVNLMRIVFEEKHNMKLVKTILEGFQRLRC